MEKTKYLSAFPVRTGTAEFWVIVSVPDSDPPPWIPLVCLGHQIFRPKRVQYRPINSIEGGSHVTLTGHARAGMGHRI